ncbi:MAG: peptidylprolyl isomerase [Xanthomonadales bacterium]|nr:peptidylprolyl isomerase [Xanthomonadales bacterium]
MRKLILLIAVLISATALSQEQVSGENPQATIHTNRGDIRIELFANEAPASVENFLQYARDGHYDGTIFHRVISHFMIQGGGFTPDRQQKPTREPIVNEADNGLSNVRGTIAMARTNEIDSATSQFFINVELNAGLDHTGKNSSREWGYAVFGKVVDGMDVVDDIRFVETGPGDWPVEDVLIESVEVH